MSTTSAILASACAESGWDFAERSTRYLVRLETDRDGAPFYARIEADADGQIFAWVDLTSAILVFDTASAPGAGMAGEAKTQSPVCLRAAEAMLAEVTRRVRGVRGVVREEAGRSVVGLLARLPAANGEDLAEAISALSVACQLAGPEIKLLLSDSAIAGLYLDDCVRLHAHAASNAAEGQPLNVK